MEKEASGGTMLHHVALQCAQNGRSAAFLTGVLGIPRTRDFTISSDLSTKIFGEKREVHVEVFEAPGVFFEVFYTPAVPNPPFEHVCVTVPDLKAAVERCRHGGFEYYTVDRGNKLLHFMKDGDGHLFEIKEG